MIKKFIHRGGYTNSEIVYSIDENGLIYYGGYEGYIFGLIKDGFIYEGGYDNGVILACIDEDGLIHRGGYTNGPIIYNIGEDGLIYEGGYTGRIAFCVEDIIED